MAPWRILHFFSQTDGSDSLFVGGSDSFRDFHDELDFTPPGPNFDHGTKAPVCSRTRRCAQVGGPEHWKG